MPARSRTRALPALLLASTTALALAGCAAAAEPAGTEGPSIVASTNVYGDLAASIAGELATVTSIIDSPAIDPHSYEASAQDQLAVANADLVVENGGGYDPFIDVLIEGSGAAAPVVTAAAIAGIDDDHAHGGEEAHSDDEGEAHSDEGDAHSHAAGENEHVWYDIHVMEEVAAAIAAELVELDPDNAAAYEQNLADLEAEFEALDAELVAAAEALGGGIVAATEPVPAYLLAELGFTDETPEQFTEAIEEGADVPPLALQQTLDLIDSGEVTLLAYNEQTASPETERVREAAEAAGIPVVSFVETLPEGEDYVSWMRANIEAVTQALTPA